MERTTSKTNQGSTGRGTTPPDTDKNSDRNKDKGQVQGTPGRTLESPGTPGLEKEPNRDKAVGPGGQRMTSGTSAPTNDVEVPGVDKPDGINSIDPTGQTKAEDQKIL